VRDSREKEVWEGTNVESLILSSPSIIVFPRPSRRYLHAARDKLSACRPRAAKRWSNGLEPEEFSRQQVWTGHHMAKEHMLQE
jgi:hypothetical protein